MCNRQRRCNTGHTRHGDSGGVLGNARAMHKDGSRLHAGLQHHILAIFDKIRTFQQEILRIKDKYYFPIIIVGNHCERESEREVSMQEGWELARQFGCRFLEVSSSRNINVENAFYHLVREIREYEKREAELGPEVGNKPAAWPEWRRRNWFRRTEIDPSPEVVDES